MSNPPNSEMEMDLNTGAPPPSPESFKSSWESVNQTSGLLEDNLEKHRMAREALTKSDMAKT
jgi:hypothetical protein